jgi:hypothetical protein
VTHSVAQPLLLHINRKNQAADELPAATTEGRCEMSRAVRAFVASSILSLVAVMSVYGMDGAQVSAKVPFGFTAGEKSFPPGNYVFSLDDPDVPTLVSVESKNGDKYVLMLSETRTLSEPADQTKLVFEKYGKQHILSQLWIMGLDLVEVIPESEIQREVAQKTEQHESVIIDAHKQ